MKIVMINWPINNIGGIATWAIYMRDALIEMGHKVTCLHLGETFSRDKVEPVDLFEGGVKLAGRYITLGSEERVSQLMDWVNKQELVIFVHPSPHPTKHQLSVKTGGYLWMQVYKNLTVPSVVVFHDNMWERTNSWLEDVAPHINKIFCDQAFHMDSASRFPGSPKLVHGHFPLPVPATPPSNKVERNGRFVMMTQWIGWKRHEEFLPHLPESPVEYDIFGDGIKYCYARRDSDVFKKHISDLTRGVLAPDERAKYHGCVSHQEILGFLTRSSAAVDFSKRGYVNFTHWEPLLHGAASFVHQDVLRLKSCKLPRKALVIPFNDVNFNDQVSAFLDMPEKEIVARRLLGWEFCREFLEPKKVATSLLEFANA
jgi:hypothetical protein